MSKYAINDTTLDNIATPIMSMRGLTSGLTPEEMATNANTVLTNITDALNAISAKGVDISGKNSDDLKTLIEYLTKLPALTTPGASADLRTGKQLIDGSGSIVTGTMPEQATQTITPGTSDKTIASGRYLVGTQTIKGDSNLVAANIAKGKSIFGVSGTYTGGGKIAAGTFTMAIGDTTHTVTHSLGSVPNLTATILASQNLDNAVGSSGGVVSEIFYKGTKYTVTFGGSNDLRLATSTGSITSSTTGFGSATTSQITYKSKTQLYYPADVAYVVGVV